MSNLNTSTATLFKLAITSALDEAPTDIDECMISKEPLKDNHIKLECGHHFNYVPLFKEIHYKKKYSNALDTTLLSYNQMYCPYCRTIYPYILPYQELDGVTRITGVNSPDKLSMPLYKCTWVKRYGKTKGEICNTKCGLYKNGTYCTRHLMTSKSSNNKQSASNKCVFIKKNGEQCKRYSSKNKTTCHCHV